MSAITVARYPAGVGRDLWTTPGRWRDRALAPDDTQASHRHGSRRGGNEVEVLAPGQFAIHDRVLVLIGCGQHVVADETKHLGDLDVGSLHPAEQRRREWAVAAATIIGDL